MIEAYYFSYIYGLKIFSLLCTLFSYSFSFSEHVQSNDLDGLGSVENIEEGLDFGWL